MFLWVGITAPIEILKQCEKERGDRQLSTRWQAEHVHEGVEFVFSLKNRIFISQNKDKIIVIIRNNRVGKPKRKADSECQK